ncbi:MAG: hypothetical protein V2J65_30770 [Desulfobacteraceae bacterium]|jgi:putative cardiolipin synthase|nr:hypothetical protein [Desulfobacteraceae bacterium]
MLTGCATTLPTDVQRTPSTAIVNYDTISTGQLFEEAALRHLGKSGFAIIRKGRPAFTGRIAMTAMAKKSMDLQHYIWEPDTTGRILVLRLVEAADRGVRVRILVDDNTFAGRDSRPSPPYLYPLDEDVESLIGQFEEIRSSLIWSPGQVVSRPFSFRGLQ